MQDEKRGRGWPFKSCCCCVCAPCFLEGEENGENGVQFQLQKKMESASASASPSAAMVAIYLTGASN